MPSIAVLGTGLMGSAAAERLASRGFNVVLWNRTRSKAEELASKIRAEVADSVEAAVSGAQYALAFLADDEALISVASRVGRSDGLVFINSSTITPQTSRAVNDHLARLGACYVESPVVGGPSSVRSGRAIVLVGGEGHCISQAAPVIESLGEKIIRLSRVEEAAALKLSFNNLLLTTLAGLAESLLLASLYGVDPDVLLELLESTVFSGVSKRYSARLLGREKVLSFKLRLAAKDSHYASLALNAAGAPSFISSQVSQLFRAASPRYGDSDYSRIYDFLKELTKGEQD